MHDRGGKQGVMRYLRVGAALLCLLAAGRAAAVVTVDNVSTVVDNNPTSLTVSHATGSGSDRLMLVGVSLLNEDLETVSGVTYGGTPLTFVGQRSQFNDSRVEIWALLNPPTTTANVVVTFNEQVQLGAIVGVITFAGVDQSSPYGAFQSNSGDSTTASATVGSAAGELVFGVMGAERQDNNPAVSGGTERWALKSQPGNNRTAGAGATFTGAASVTLTWNLNEPDDWAIGAVSLRPAAGGGGGSAVDTIILSTWDDETLGGLSFGDDDLAEYNATTDTATLFFDGGSIFSNNNEDIDAVHVLDNGNIVLSTTGNATIGGINVTDGDLAEYDPVNDTATELFDEGNFSGGADVNAVFVRADGFIILSTDANETLGGLSFEDEDLVLYDPVNDVATLFLDGDAVFAGEEDIDGVYVLPNGNILLSTDGSATIGGLNFLDGDIVEYNPSTGIATLYFSESNFSGGADISALHIRQAMTTALAYYAMEEASWSGTPGEVVDSSGSGNDGTAIGNANTIDPGYICRGADIPFNNTDAAQDAVDSGLDMDSDIGVRGTISFWYKSDVAWTGGGDRMLVDASTTADNKYFFLVLLNNGALRFRIEDSVDADFQLQTSAKAFPADEWHHIAMTWDLPGDRMEIYLDGVLDASLTPNTSGAWGALGTVYFGDNRSTYHPSGTANSANGVIDEARIYNFVQTATQVQADRDDPGACLQAYAWFQLDATPGTWNGTPGEVVDQQGTVTTARALGTGSGVNSVPTPICRGIDIPFNNTDAAQYGFDSRIDADDDIGNSGTISFWYNSDNAWAGGGDRALFDASPDSLSSPDKFFLLMLRNDGALQFAVEDDTDTDFLFNTPVQGFAAGTWVHVAVTWSMTGSRQIFINGTLAATDARATSGALGELDTFYFGDNRSTYHFGGTSNSANGVIDEVRVYTSILTAAQITTDMNATHACATPALDHFRITPATTSASTCLPNAITIAAEDSSNNTIVDYTGTVTITTSTNNGNWSVNTAANVTVPNPDNDDDGTVDYSFLLADAGDIILDLSNTHAETLTITVTDPLLVVSSTSVVISFADNVFVITEDPIQVAGRPQAMSVAMWTNDGSNCFIDTNYDYASVSLDASIDRGGVLPAAADPTIGGTTIPDSPASNPVALDFSVTPGQAAFTLATTDVGQYRLTLIDNTNLHAAGPISGTGALLTVRPFGLAVTTIEALPGPVANPGGTLPADPVFTVAGGDFSATVAGVLWAAADDTDNDGVLDTGVYADNAVAPSYAWNTLLSVSGVGFTPATGAPGGLNNGSVAQASFSGGSATVTNLQYTEVGSFTLQSSATDFLGEPSADLVGDDIVVGRFLPASFDITIVDNGVFAEACGVFTYLGQDFGYATAPRVTAIARNALGATTTQYRDAFNKLNGTSITADTSRDDTTLGSDSNPLLVSYATVAMSFSRNPGSADFTFGADVFRYGPDLPLTTFSKLGNSRVGPFTADINPEISQVSDGEVSTIFTPGTHVLDPTGNNLRFGRLRMENTHGSEVDPLRMPAFAEYWTGAGFARNLLDTCTAIADADLVSVASPPGLSTPTVINNPASAGDVDYSYPAPGAGNDGFVDTTTDLNSANHLWLRYDWNNDGVFDNDSAARATFGIYDGSPVQIYIQQIYE